METIHKLKDVSKVYHTGKGKEIYALDCINMEIYKGETFGVIGESGSGKTTLGKVMTLLIKPTDGRIYFKGRDITEMKGKEVIKFRKEVQIVFQDPYRSLNPRMSVVETVMEGIREGKGREERAKELLGMVGIEGKRISNYPHQFSGGERQRICIARALSTSPSFIVCDEPTSNLDLSVQAKILNLFMELKERFNLTYLFITHNIKIINLIADRVAVMYKGKVVEYGKREDIMKNPVHPYTSFLISSSFLKKSVIAERGIPDREGCVFYPLCVYGEEVCRKEIPELKEIEKGHFVACFRI